MGTFLYLPQGLSGSPYEHYLTPTLWAEINEIFMRDACNLLGLSIDSPLSIWYKFCFLMLDGVIFVNKILCSNFRFFSVNAGCTALPALLNIKYVMQQRQVTSMWNGKDELPVSKRLIFPCTIIFGRGAETAVFCTLEKFDVLNWENEKVLEILFFCLNFLKIYPEVRKKFSISSLNFHKIGIKVTYNFFNPSFDFFNNFIHNYLSWEAQELVLA